MLRFDGNTGEFMDAFVDDTTLVTPFSLIFGPEENLYVSSARKNAVLRYDGKTVAYLGVAAQGGDLRQPIGLRFGPGGMLYVVNNVGGNVLRFNPETGRWLGVFASDSLKFPSDLVFGIDGLLYVTSPRTGAVTRYDSTGGLVDVFGRLPEGSAPVGIHVAGDGSIVVSDSMQGRLFRFAQSGGPPTTLSDTGMSGPENIVIRKWHYRISRLYRDWIPGRRCTRPHGSANRKTHGSCSMAAPHWRSSMQPTRARHWAGPFTDPVIEVVLQNVRRRTSG